ncbi:hypothetical protein [Pseudonocardia abyssalis]|uniref:Uncharacterized protein n=1 Tax=Pseudonocardia abyssalis TaxID=2792008 RepID=A0ABS6UYZ5_9PSEU|nr:hypothetical protein [Pseudonocardia abyssalis]MBW0137469.1 hypothetical protein [Pseudonocardia abyssalis]
MADDPTAAVRHRYRATAAQRWAVVTVSVGAVLPAVGTLVVLRVPARCRPVPRRSWSVSQRSWSVSQRWPAGSASGPPRS